MKKLNLKGIGKILSNEEMKKVTGGYSCDARPCPGAVYVCSDVSCVGGRRISCTNNGFCVPY